MLEVGRTDVFNDWFERLRDENAQARIARRSGLSREALYRSLSTEGNPEFATVLKVIRALGLRLTVAA